MLDFQIGGGLFVFVQVIILIDFFYAWHENWAVRRGEKWKWLIRFTIISLYVISWALLPFQILWFVPSTPKCWYNALLIATTGAFTIIFLVLGWCGTRLGIVRGAGLPSGFMALYITFLAWSAMAHQP